MNASAAGRFCTARAPAPLWHECCYDLRRDRRPTADTPRGPSRELKGEHFKMRSNGKSLTMRASALALGLMFALPSVGLAQTGYWGQDNRRDDRRERREDRSE